MRKIRLSLMDQDDKPLAGVNVMVEFYQTDKVYPVRNNYKTDGNGEIETMPLDADKGISVYIRE